MSKRCYSSAMVTDQSLIDEPRNGNVDDQQPPSDNVDNQQPAIDQVRQNEIANVPNGLVVQQQPRRQQPQGLYSLPPHIREVHPTAMPKLTVSLNKDEVLYRIPHFHFYFGNQHWTFNDFSQRIPTTGYRHYPHPMIPINICHLLPPNEPKWPLENILVKNYQLDIDPQLMPNLLVSRDEIEPGIFKEVYSTESLQSGKLRMLGSRRCMCKDFVGCNLENDEMLTIIMNTPDLTKRYSMTIHEEVPFYQLFSAYYGFTRESRNIIFVAHGKRLEVNDTPEIVGLKTNDNIYAFIKTDSIF